jgi:hypothetical protein
MAARKKDRLQYYVRLEFDPNIKYIQIYFTSSESITTDEIKWYSTDK